MIENTRLLWKMLGCQGKCSVAKEKLMVAMENVAVAKEMHISLNSKLGMLNWV